MSRAGIAGVIVPPVNGRLNSDSSGTTSPNAATRQLLRAHAVYPSFTRHDKTHGLSPDDLKFPLKINGNCPMKTLFVWP